MTSVSTFADQVAARLERIPYNGWHLKARAIVGVATFFDGFDLLSISYAMPVLVPLWHLTTQQTGVLISAAFFGQIAAAFFFGWFAERYGRMPALMLSTGLYSLMSLGCAFAWDFNSLLVMRAIEGFGIGGEVPIAAAYISEIARAKGRGRFFLLYELLVPLGLLAAVLLGWMMVPRLGWQSLFVAGAIPAFLVFFLRRWLPESPRWLASRGRDRDAEAALSRIEAASVHSLGRELPPPQAGTAIVAQRASLADLFGSIYLRRTLTVWLAWFACYFVGFGLTTWLPTIYRGVFHLSLSDALWYGVIASCCSLVGCLLCSLLIDIVGRRRWFCLAFTACALAMFWIWYHGPSPAAFVLAWVCVASFFNSTISLSVFLYTPEVYPTRLRAFAVSMAALWGRIGSAAAPNIIGFLLAGSGLGTVFVIFGAVALFAALVSGGFLVESKGRVLEDLSP
jgi:MFS transporter, putative metabolite:H+ symporter